MSYLDYYIIKMKPLQGASCIVLTNRFIKTSYQLDLTSIGNARLPNCLAYKRLPPLVVINETNLTLYPSGMGRFNLSCLDTAYSPPYRRKFFHCRINFWHLQCQTLLLISNVDSTPCSESIRVAVMVAANTAPFL